MTTVHASVPSNRPRTPLPQPQREPWSAALAPSQRRAADARAAMSRQRGAQRWLRVIAPR
jgi:hypothetical protein